MTPILGVGVMLVATVYLFSCPAFWLLVTVCIVLLVALTQLFCSVLP